MANLARKDGIFLIRFRHQGKEYKRSLKTRDRDAAEAAKHQVELTIHRLLTGMASMPPEADPAEFIVSGGTRSRPPEPVQCPVLPSIRSLIPEYLESQQNLAAPSYHDSQKIHLGHLQRHLGTHADEACDRLSIQVLDAFLQARLAKRNPLTVERERITIRQFFKWVVAQGYLETSPAAALPPIHGGKDRPPFRTVAEVNHAIDRGGLTEVEILGLWECLYLAPDEIANLLATIRDNAEELSFMLHAIPAYTGMRRGEVLRLRWLDVDLGEEYLTARSRKQSRKKTETVRHIDMHPELKKELLAWREQRPKCQYVICEAKSLEPLEKDRANRCFWQPMRGTDWCLGSKKNWFKVGFHTYRHSFASNLAARGVDQRIIDEWMGHQTEAMRKRYRHLFPKDRRSAIECFSLVMDRELGQDAKGGCP